jgi:hypothetical protein
MTPRELGVYARSAFVKCEYCSSRRNGTWSRLLFNDEPWEAYDSGYNEASLAAVAVSMALENYRAAAEIQYNLNRLGKCLNRDYGT